MNTLMPWLSRNVSCVAEPEPARARVVVEAPQGPEPATQVLEDVAISATTDGLSDQPQSVHILDTERVGADSQDVIRG